jgi:uncharacterized membrane protein
MIREHFIDHSKIDKDKIRRRGYEVSRIEAFSDAVFAFAVTLLIVALEVPHDYHELHEKMLGFFGFGLAFLLLFQVWYTQNLFFRRYGLHDFWTIVLNGMLIFTVLFFVYPLKFLVSIFSSPVLQAMTEHELRELMTVYSLGFGTIFIIFTLMHVNALKKGHHINLNAEEIFETKTQVYRNILFASFGIVITVASLLLPIQLIGIAGMSFALIGPGTAILHSRRGKVFRKTFGEPPPLSQSGSPSQG